MSAIPTDSAAKAPVVRSSDPSTGDDDEAVNASAIADPSTPLIATIGSVVNDDDDADNDTLGAAYPVTASTYSRSVLVGVVA